MAVKRKQKGDSRLEVKPSKIHGLGLFATEKIRKGSFLGEIQGPRAKRNGSHVLWVEELDGEVYGIRAMNDLRYANHSKRPNVEMDGPEMWAIKNIAPGDEITFDYGEGWD